MKIQSKNCNLAFSAAISTISCFLAGIGWEAAEQVCQYQIQDELRRTEFVNYFEPKGASAEGWKAHNRMHACGRCGECSLPTEVTPPSE